MLRKDCTSVKTGRATDARERNVLAHPSRFNIVRSARFASFYKQARGRFQRDFHRLFTVEYAAFPCKNVQLLGCDCPIDSILESVAASDNFAPS
jgi:hypothetical protein